MGMWGDLVTDPDSGWQDITVHKGRRRPRGWPQWTAWTVKHLSRAVAWLVVLVVGFVAFNWLLTAAAVGPLYLYVDGLPWAALGVVLAVLAVLGAWFWLAAESFDGWVSTPLRQWWRRRRYRRRWADLMVGCGLTVKDRKRHQLAPRIVRVRSGRFADVLGVRLPAGITAETFADRLPEVTEALRARDARIIAAPRRRLPAWLRGRLSAEYAPGTTRPGRVWLRLAFGDPLVHVVTTDHSAEAAAVDFNAVPVGRCDDGRDWLLSLLGTHVLLAGATGSGKGSVLWSLLGALGPAIRDGLVHVVGIDPKGGMELGYGHELFRSLLTMDGDTAESEAVEFLEQLASEADRRAAALAGHARSLEPSPEFPFLVVVVDELASVTAFIADSKLRQRADAALGRLLTKGRAPGMCVIGALQDPRKEVVKWRDLFPTRIALRLVERGQVDLVLGDGARDRGAKCDHIAESAPGVGYFVEDGSRTVTRVRAAYLTDDEIRRLAQTYQPGPVVASSLHLVNGGDAA